MRAARERDGKPLLGQGYHRCPVTHLASAAKPARAAALAAVLVLLPGASPAPGPEETLADGLRQLYGGSVQPWERWRRRSAVRLPDGREVSARGGLPGRPRLRPRRPAAAGEPRRRRRAARGLAARHPAGGPPARGGAGAGRGARPPRRARGLRGGAGAGPGRRPGVPRRAAAGGRGRLLGGSAGRVGLRRGRDPPEDRGPALAPPRPASIASADTGPALAPGFRRGVSWWMSEGRADAGEASFRRLASLGVTWVSIHTWDPLQRGLDEPVFAQPDRHFGFRDLGALVKSAHAAGLRVMVKPHLEMRGYEPTEEERRIFRGPDGEARRALVARVESQMAPGRAPPAQPDRDAQRGRLAAVVPTATRPTCCPTRATRRPPAPTCSAWGGRWTRRSSAAKPTGARSSPSSAPSSTAPSPTRRTSTPGRASGSGTPSTSSASPRTSPSPIAPLLRSPSSRRAGTGRSRRSSRPPAASAAPCS